MFAVKYKLLGKERKNISNIFEILDSDGNNLFNY